jgi:uncharacterized protein (TIGR02266 family)
MDQKTTKSPHPPVNLRIKFRSDSLPQFIERYATDVSRGGIFIRTREPLGVGTQLKLDFQYQGGTPLMSGDGTVVWVREFDPNRANVPPGMGVRFDKLAPESLAVLEQILAAKAERDGGAAGATSGGASRPGPPESVPGGGRRPGTGSAPQAATPQVAIPQTAPPRTEAAPQTAAPQASVVARPIFPAAPDSPAAGAPAVTPVSSPTPTRTTSSIFPETPSLLDPDELDEEPTQIAAGLPSLMGGGPELEDNASSLVSAPRLPGMAATSRPGGPVAPVDLAGNPLGNPGQPSSSAASEVFTSALRADPAREPSSLAVPRATRQPEPSEESTTESTVPSLGELGAARGGSGEVAPRATDDDSSSNFSAATTTTPLDPADLIESTASPGPGHEEPVTTSTAVPELRGPPGAGEPTQSLSLDGLHPEGAPEPRPPSAVAMQAGPRGTSTPSDARVGGGSPQAPGPTRDRDVEVPAPPSAAHARERRLPVSLILVTGLALAATSFFVVRFFKSQATDLIPGTEPGHTAMESPGAPPPVLRAAEPEATGAPAPGPAGTASAEPTTVGAPAAQGANALDAGAGAAAPPAVTGAVTTAAPTTSTDGNDAQASAKAGAKAGAKTAQPPTEATPAPEVARPGTEPDGKTPEGKIKPDTSKTDSKVEVSHPRESKPEKAAAPRRKPLRLARTSGPAGAASAAGNGDGEAEAPGGDARGVASKGGGGPIYELKIASKPPGGDVSIDGQVVGKTPFTGNVGDLGSPHFVTIRRDGFELFEQMVGTNSAWVKVKAGKPGAGSTVQQLKLNVKLRPLAGTPVEPPAETGDRPAGEAAPKLDKADKADKPDKADDNTLPPTDPVAPGGAPQ